MCETEVHNTSESLIHNELFPEIQIVIVDLNMIYVIEGLLAFETPIAEVG